MSRGNTMVIPQKSASEGPLADQDRLRSGNVYRPTGRATARDRPYYTRCGSKSYFLTKDQA